MISFVRSGPLNRAAGDPDAASAEPGSGIRLQAPLPLPPRRPLPPVRAVACRVCRDPAADPQLLPLAPGPLPPPPPADSGEDVRSHSHASCAGDQVESRAPASLGGAGSRKALPPPTGVVAPSEKLPQDRPDSDSNPAFV
eukprot:scaffold1683_cov125-Isochrysis_galbana.AAC.5